MLAQIKNQLLIASTTVQVKVVLQIIILALMLIGAFVSADAALAGPSWGNIGG